MGLRDLSLHLAYESGSDSMKLLDEFYIPTLENAKAYYRIAGFFSSSALTVAAKGIEGLIHNEGKMYLLVSPELSKSDYEILCEHGSPTGKCRIFSDFDVSSYSDDHLKLLAWLLDVGRLKIKIVVGKKAGNSLFHEKIGIIKDKNGDRISFSGSINESAQAWLHNIEEFKVFRSWIPDQDAYLKQDFERFRNFWKGNRSDIAEVYDIPDSIREKLIQIKPDNVDDLKIMRTYKKYKNFGRNKLSLFPHQREAVEKWKTNGCSLLMEMATGTGKTRTAIGCMLEKLQEDDPLLVVVATPQNTLSRQWKDDIDKLEIRMDRSEFIDGSNPKWRVDLELLFSAFYNRTISNAVIFTTHVTASSADFISIIKRNKSSTKILFICDEVHGSGSVVHQKALLSEYEYRIGLSATPERLYDEDGTDLIRNYFGDASYEFSIAQALHTVNPLTGKPFLNPFRYIPIFIGLTPDETQKFKELTRKIVGLVFKKNKSKDEESLLNRLNIKRADIRKNAERKIPALRQLLENMHPPRIRDTILFVTEKQMVPCFQIMYKLGIRRAKITEEESATKIVNTKGETERQAIISQFTRHDLQVLVGIKCLDEGIDITSARVAILMASSANPREYVQRVGRVIRPGKGKDESEIYDFIVDAPESNVLNQEGQRVALIAQNALNYEEVKKAFMEKGVDLDAYQQEDQNRN